MALRFYDTLTRSVKNFEPANPPQVRLYACGPTVYDYAHIGNYRSFLVYDLLYRYLTWSGYDVDFVMNLTDVDDRTIERAAEEGKGITEYTAPFSEQILADARAAAERIQRDAATAIDRELRRGQASLREEASELAISLAADLLRERVGPEDRQRLLDDFIQSVEEAPASGLPEGGS